MKQAHKKRPHLAAANSPPELPDMGEIYFINLINVILLIFSLLYINKMTIETLRKRNRIETKSVF